MVKVMIDPGHGGTDPGASGCGFKEKDLNLILGMCVGDVLKAHKVGVSYTRTTDKYLSLKERADMANKAGVDYFFSVHFNAYRDLSANGVETLHYPSSSGSKATGATFHNELIKVLKVRNRGLKPQNVAVLRRTKMKANLVETCFITNANDMKFFVDNFEKIVNQMAKSILKVLGVAYKEPVKPDVKPAPDKKPAEKKDFVVMRVIGEHVQVPGFLKDGKSYITVNDSHFELREILEALDLLVGWDNKNKIVTADKTNDFKASDSAVSILLLGNRIDVSAILREGKWCLEIKNAYIPIRDIFETMGFKVSWDNDKKRIVISK